MKKIYILTACMTLSLAAFSQCSVVVNSFTNVSCHGQCDGSANLTSLGLPPFTYSWAPQGQTVQNPTDLCPGTHTVTMVDANSCQSTATVTITEPAVLTSSMAANNVTCFGECNGSATASPSGGTAPYTYQWDAASGNQATPTATNLCAGTYTVLITDVNGCTTTDQVIITQPSALSISTSTTPATCQACTDGSASAFVNGGTPSYSYLWSPGGQTSQTAVNLGGGSYTVTATDAQGCSISDTVQVMAPTGIIATNGGLSINVYPNPIVNIANIEIINGPIDQVMYITLFDITGKMIDSKQENAGRQDIVQVNFENVPAGAYLMEIRAGDAKMTVKVFKQ
jgi:hypothetical protein